jgi:hypothetical protein
VIGNILEISSFDCCDFKPGETALIGAPTVMRYGDGEAQLEVGCTIRLRDDSAAPEHDEILRDRDGLRAALGVWDVHALDAKGLCVVCQVEECNPRTRACKLLVACGARPYLVVAPKGGSGHPVLTIGTRTDDPNRNVGELYGGQIDIEDVRLDFHPILKLAQWSWDHHSVTASSHCGLCGPDVPAPCEPWIWSEMILEQAAPLAIHAVAPSPAEAGRLREHLTDGAARFEDAREEPE